MKGTYVMNRTCKFRIYPTKQQEQLFRKTFGCCRKVWNLILADKKRFYEATGSFGTQTPARYKNSFPYLKEVDSFALCNIQLQLQKAVRDACRNKKAFRFPKFKSKKHCRKHSYTTNNNTGNIRISGSHIRLPKAGDVKAVIHRPIPEHWKLKSATVSMEPDGKFYVSVLFEYEGQTVPATGNTDAIGLDYKLDGLYADSSGNTAGMPRYYRESLTKLARGQRRLSRKQKGSQNYLKQLRKVNKVHAKIRNQRCDFLHKLSNGIANRYGIVCVEDLNLRSMANKSFHNGMSVADAGYGMFLGMLAYKLPERGGKLVAVSRWYPSSQLCSRCGMRHPEMKDLRIRAMHCPCGNHMDRDTNASINILKEGLRIAAASA